jgi:hypothetical protein
VIGLQKRGNTMQETRLSFLPNFSENIFANILSDFEKNNH